jgi:hypothetical protein
MLNDHGLRGPATLRSPSGIGRGTP